MSAEAEAMCRALALVLVVLALLPAVASARTLHTSPGGTLSAGAPCSETEPCGIGRASLDAGSGDTIQIGPGSYGSSVAPLGFGIGSSQPAVVWIGDPRATLWIDNADPSSFDLSTGQVLRGNGMTVRSFDPVGLRLLHDARAVRIRVVNLSGLPGAKACQLLGGAGEVGDLSQLMSADCSAAGPSSGMQAVAVQAAGNDQAFTVAGVTAYADSPGSAAIRFVNTTPTGGSGKSDLRVSLSIAAAVGVGARDIDATGDDIDRRACITARHTASSSSSATGQCALAEVAGVRDGPLFVNATSDHHQQLGSPLIDPFAGAATGTTFFEFDLDGLPRDAANPDPGAYERRVAIGQTTAAADLASTSATLTGRVRPSYGVGIARFQYGETTRYTDVTAAREVTATADVVELREAITGLVAGRTYHARVVLMDGDERDVLGEDVTFTAPQVVLSPAELAGGVAAGEPDPAAQPSPPRRTAVAVRCRVPRLTTLKLSDAKRRLKAAHCRLGIVRRTIKTGGRVRRQSAKAGRILSAGARISLTLGPSRCCKPRTRTGLAAAGWRRSSAP